MLGPSFAKPSATGLRMSPRFGLASLLLKESTGDVAVALVMGLVILLSGSGIVAAASAVASEGITSTLFGAPNLGLPVVLVEAFLAREVCLFFFFHGSGMVIVMLSLSLSASSCCSSLSTCSSSWLTMNTPSWVWICCGGVGGRSRSRSGLSSGCVAEGGLALQPPCIGALMAASPHLVFRILSCAK